MFGEDICNLLKGRDVLNMKIILENLITNKVQVHFYIYVWFEMEHRICS